MISKEVYQLFDRCPYVLKRWQKGRVSARVWFHEGQDVLDHVANDDLPTLINTE